MTDLKPDDTKLTPDGVSIFDICETDVNAEEEGRWFTDIFDDGTNIDVKLRRLMSTASVNVRRRLDKGYRKYMKNGVYTDTDIAIRVMNEQIAEAVLIDWRGIKVRDAEGKLVDLPYSKENAMMLLTKLRHFRDSIIMMSQNLDNFRVEDREDTGKN